MVAARVVLHGSTVMYIDTLSLSEISVNTGLYTVRSVSYKASCKQHHPLMFIERMCLRMLRVVASIEFTCPHFLERIQKGLG